MTWIPLNVHSQYSILDSTLSVSILAEQAARFSIPALALTDQGNLYGAIDFYKACTSQGVRPILGSELWMAPGSRLEKKKGVGIPNGFPIVLLAKSLKGYQNLCKLSSIGFLEGFYYQPRIDKETLKAHAEGLICLSGPIDGAICWRILQGDEASLLQEIRWYQDLFKEDFYFEIQRHPFKETEDLSENWLSQKMRVYASNQEKVNQKLIELSKRLSIPLVATNDIHYL